MATTIFRTAFFYLVILISLRVMGKRQLGELQTSELVVTLLLSEIAVIPIENHRISLLLGMTPMVLLVIFEIAMSYAMLKSDRIRNLVCGKPQIIISHGVIIQKSMRKLRMTTEDLFEQLRQNNVFYIEEVEFAIVETNGLISILKKADYDNVSPEQMGLEVHSAGLQVVVVSDGALAKSSIELCGKTVDWVLLKIQEKQLTLKEVFIMTVTTTGTFQIIKKESRASSHAL